MGDHTEAIEVTYDPAAISYEELLQVFWSAHQPIHEPWSAQYRSAIWPADAEQRAVAEASLAAEATRRGQRIFTAIEAPTAFTPAETYHQKYRLRHDEVLMAELRAVYPEPEALMRSTVAARLNGLLSGDADPALIERELGLYGLSDEAQVHLQLTLDARRW